jgi:hypothetical protein
MASQRAQQQSLLDALSGADRNIQAAPESVARLRAWLKSLPVTGRVPVTLADARWLQAHPVRDPVLLPGDKFVLPDRPRTVTVVTDDGERCAVPHQPGFEASSYLRACTSDAALGADWAWVAQPDGKTQRFGIARWNAQAQDEPAPGAWIWGPRRGLGWPEPFSEALIEFLATQGPAPDQGVDSRNHRDPRNSAWRERGLKSAKAEALGGVPPSRASGIRWTSSDWGTVGLLQTPTARMREAGAFSLGVSKVRPYTHGNIFFQPFDWLEAGFRYSDISNRRYGPFELSGDQSYKDKSLGLKIRLLRETAYLPQLAVGMIDAAGTGVFSGEYLVASKRFGAFDWHLGMGWGYVGGRGDIRNPLSRLSSSFDTRSVNVGRGGNFLFDTYFRGPAALFGGVEYQTPWDDLILKAEVDGNGYQQEPFANRFSQRTPVNIGAVYRVTKGLDLNIGLERGNTAMVGLTMHAPLDRLWVPKVDDPRPLRVIARRETQDPVWAATHADFVDQTQWSLREIERTGRELRLTVDSANAVYWRERLDRGVAVLHRDAPASIDRFVIVYRHHGIEVAEHVIDRDAWVAQNTQPVPPGLWRESVVARSPTPPSEELTPLVRQPDRAFESGVALSFRHTLGGPNGFILYEAGLTGFAYWRLRRDTWVQGSVNVGVIDNYENFEYDAPSGLPRVRTDTRQYLTSSPLTLPNLQFTHVRRLSENHYLSGYGGLLELMFAGVGGEWLYRPFASRLALGVDVNAVQQRAPDQYFGMRDYRTLTGHATAYWDTGWNDLHAKVSVGRYLAKDVGATFDLSRQFRNGVRVGGWFSKTSASAEQFGEGSFDKAVYLHIPFDAMLTRTGAGIARFNWQPLTRDGGAKLARSVTLYDMTNPRSNRVLLIRSAAP